MVEEQLGCHHKPVTIVDELWHLVETAWAIVDVFTMQSLLDSMPRRTTAAIV